MKNKVTDKIRKLREKKGLSQQNVADELGMEHSSYSKIERGVTDPSVTRLFALAKIFGVEVTEFFTDNDASAFKETKESYGNISKEDLEKLNQSIQKLVIEINTLRTDLSEKKTPLKPKRTKKP